MHARAIINAQVATATSVAANKNTTMLQANANIMLLVRKTLNTLGPAVDAREWMQMEKFNHIQPKGTMRMPNLSLNLLAQRVLKSRSVQCTPTNVQTAGYLTLLDDALHQEVKEQVKHIHVKDQNLQPRTMTRMP